MRTESVSRREFLKTAGIAGASVGLGAGLGGLVAACGGGSGETTTTAAGVTTTAGATTTTAAASTTTISTGPEAGRAIKIGVVSPKTGNFAVFAISDDWWIGHAKEAVKDGIIGGDGKSRQIELIVKDGQFRCEPRIAGSNLVTLDKVDLLLASGTPDTVNPVAIQGETLGCPACTASARGRRCLIGQDGKPVEFKWAYGNLLGSEVTIASFHGDVRAGTDQQEGRDVFANDVDAKGWMDPTAAPKVFAEKGYTLVVPDYYNVPAEDFTKQIGMFKSQGCEIVCGTDDPPWFSNFWTQCYQQGFKPKCCSSARP